MSGFIIRRLLAMVPTLFLISIVCFIIIQLPPGDFMTSLQAQAASSGSSADQAAMDNLRHQYGLDQPKYIRYLKWIAGFPRGDFGYSLEWQRPVSELLAGRLGLTRAPFGALLTVHVHDRYSGGHLLAIHKYSAADHTLTFFGFLGLSVPDFLLGLIYLFVGIFLFNTSVAGLFSPEMAEAPWSLAKALNLVNHLFWPALILGAAGTAQLIRILRGSMLEVLGQQFVNTARAKGLQEATVIRKHVVKVAVNPLISVVGMQLPQLISGATILGIVLSLPTTGPMFVRALVSQDMYLAGTFLLMLSLMLMLGNLLADVALAWIDPRIRYE